MRSSIGEFGFIHAMNVTVHLHTILQRESSQGMVDRLEVGLASGSTIADLLLNLEIDLPAEALLLVVNGRMAEASQTLKEGDQVNLMPALSGG
jgi:sulfur carrier protein ThiS